MKQERIDPELISEMRQSRDGDSPHLAAYTGRWHPMFFITGRKVDNFDSATELPHLIENTRRPGDDAVIRKTELRPELHAAGPAIFCCIFGHVAPYGQPGLKPGQ